jgi:hypothetical protein
MLLNKRALALSWALGIAGAGVAACRVEQTQEPQAPAVDVDVDPGQWPNYDVSWADVDVGTREATVEVPIVRVERETRQITVPYIDINPPGSADREEQTISMELWRNIACGMERSEPGGARLSCRLRNPVESMEDESTVTSQGGVQMIRVARRTAGP